MEKIVAFTVTSEEYDGFIIARDSEEIKQAIDCMHMGAKASDYSEPSSFIQIDIKTFTKKEYDKIMSREWQP